MASLCLYEEGMPMIYDLQRASMWKRISAWLLDAILLCIVATLMAFLLSTALNYDKYSAQLDAPSVTTGREQTTQTMLAITSCPRIFSHDRKLFLPEFFISDLSFEGLCFSFQ